MSWAFIPSPRERIFVLNFMPFTQGTYMGYTGMCRSTGYAFYPSDSGTGYKNHSLPLEEGYILFQFDSGTVAFFPTITIKLRRETTLPSSFTEPGTDTGQASSSHAGHFRSVMSYGYIFMSHISFIMKHL